MIVSTTFRPDIVDESVIDSSGDPSVCIDDTKECIVLKQTHSACAVESHQTDHPIRSTFEQDRVTGRDRLNQNDSVEEEKSNVIAPNTFITCLDDIAVCPCGRHDCSFEKKTKGMRKPTDIVPLSLAVLDLLSRDDSPSYFTALLAYVARGACHELWKQKFPPLLEDAVNRLQDACEYLAVRDAECGVVRFAYGRKFIGKGKRSQEAVKVLHVKTLYALAFDLLDALKKASTQLSDNDYCNARKDVRKVIIFSFEHTTTSVSYRNSVFAWYSVLRDRAPPAIRHHTSTATSLIASLPRRKAEQVADLMFAPLCDPLRVDFPTDELTSRVISVYPQLSKAEVNRRVSFCATRDGPFGEGGLPHDPQLARLCDSHEHDGHVPPGIAAYLIIQKTLWRAIGKQKDAWTEDGNGPLVMRDSDGYPKRFLPPGCDRDWHDADAVGDSLPHSEATIVRVYNESRGTLCSSVDLQTSARRMVHGSKNPTSTLEECAKPACRVWIGGNTTNGNKKQRPAQWGRRMAKMTALLVTNEEIDEMLAERPTWMFKSSLRVPLSEERTFVKWSLAFRDAHVAYGRPKKPVNFDPSSPVVVHPLVGTWPGNSELDSTFFGSDMSSLVPIRPLILRECYVARRYNRNGREHGPVGFKRLGSHLNQVHKLRRAIAEPRPKGVPIARGLGMTLQPQQGEVQDWFAELLANSAVEQFLRMAVLFDNIVTHLKKPTAMKHDVSQPVIQHATLSHSNFETAYESVVVLHDEAIRCGDTALVNLTGRFVQAPKHISVHPIEKRAALVRTTPVDDPSLFSVAFRGHANAIVKCGRHVAGRISLPKGKEELQDSENEEEGEENSAPQFESETVSLMVLAWDCVLDQLGPSDPGHAGPSIVDKSGRRVSHGVFAQVDSELIGQSDEEFAYRWRTLYDAEITALRLSFANFPPKETQMELTSREVVFEAASIAKSVWTKRFDVRQLNTRSELGLAARKFKNTGWITRTENKFKRGTLVLDEC